jgi:hypothetical protein
VAALLLLILLCSCFLGFVIVAPIKVRKSSSQRAMISFFKDSNGAIIDESEKDADATSAGQVAYYVSTQEHGWPATYAIRDWHHLDFGGYNSTVTPAHLRAALGKHLTLHATDPTNEYARLLSKYASQIAVGDFSTTRYLPEGLFIDSLAACTAVVGVVGLILYMRNSYRICRRRARSAVGLCPACACDMLDRIGQQCPECGEVPPALD